MSIVVGLGFGDEGKGLTTSFLCSRTHNPIVVRFNGGHQAGHTVVYEDQRHIFSNFGSGTLQDVPTYWSHFCTFEPRGFLQEYKLLTQSGREPEIYVNALCRVTTPFDILHNIGSDKNREHGTVGVGFGSTIERNNTHRLLVQDLYYETVLIEKLRQIAKYYGQHATENIISEFLKDARAVRDIISIHDDSILREYNPIFEGAQGILLDMDFGFFPNVTRSNTTSKNALYLSTIKNEEIYFVTRSYLTRHGNGYLPDEQPLSLKNNERETNKEHPFQGKFRTAELNVDLLNYALKCDANYSHPCKKNLVITCLDQHEIDVDYLLDELDPAFHQVFISKGDSFEHVQLYEQKQIGSQIVWSESFTIEVPPIQRIG